jgi:hypothetical protein
VVHTTTGGLKIQPVVEVLILGHKKYKVFDEFTQGLQI